MGYLQGYTNTLNTSFVCLPGRPKVVWQEEPRPMKPSDNFPRREYKKIGEGYTRTFFICGKTCKNTVNI